MHTTTTTDVNYIRSKYSISHTQLMHSVKTYKKQHQRKVIVIK